LSLFTAYCQEINQHAVRARRRLPRTQKQITRADVALFFLLSRVECGPVRRIEYGYTS
jgi:hypothetical protein